MNPDRQGLPVPTLFSVVDDRSAAAYQVHRCLCGEDVERALRFLLNDMALKDEAGRALQGIPDALCLDDGRMAKSSVFNTVLERLDARVTTHVPAVRAGARRSGPRVKWSAPFAR